MTQYFPYGVNIMHRKYALALLGWSQLRLMSVLCIVTPLAYFFSHFRLTFHGVMPKVSASLWYLLNQCV